MRAIKLGFLSLFLISFVSVTKTFALSPPVDPDLQVNGKINVISGANGNEAIDINSLLIQEDRVAFFSAEQAYRFELISASPLQNSQHSRFEFDYFGHYVCSGDATVDSVEYGNVIALAGVKPPLLQLGLTFNGSCRIANDLLVQFTGTLEFHRNPLVDSCLDEKVTIENLNQEVDELTSQISDLIQERDDALGLYIKSEGDKKIIKRLLAKTNPKSTVSLKTLYTQLKRVLSPSK